MRVKRKSNETNNGNDNKLKVPKLESEDDTLRKLSSLVGKAGSSMNASMAAVVKSSANDNKEESDPRNVFTCLKCFERFSGIEELSDHMIRTKHFGTTSNYPLPKQM